MKSLKLGTETGSFINHLQSESNTLPEVGKGATQLLWSDRSAYFVDEVSKDKKSVVIEKAKAVRTDGNGRSDAQTYKFERAENPVRLNLRFRYGFWNIDRGPDVAKSERYARINIKFGYMDEYYDYSF